MAASGGEMDEEEWEAVAALSKHALDHLKAFRRQEGRALESDLLIPFAR